jgi:hypothetical protein
MRILSVAFGVLVLFDSANAQIIRDPPWNPEHIDHLPAEVRSAVLAKCSSRPDAGHYFASYFHDEIHLHYEHLHCDTASFCDGSQMPPSNLQIKWRSLPPRKELLQFS